jgi:hypothetical protein
MKTLLAIALAAVAALAFTSSASAATKAPNLSVFSAKVKAAQDSRSYAKYRIERGGAWDDYDGEEGGFAWDDRELFKPSCSRVARSVVDCKLRVRLFVTAYDDDDSYTASEDCRWKIRYRRGRGGYVSGYQLFEGGGSGGDFGSVPCDGWYGEDDAR